MPTFSEYISEKQYDVTSTEYKLGVIQNENEFIKSCGIIRRRNDQVVGVIGNTEGVSRHIEQLADLGFNDSNMYFFELDNKMYNDLRRYFDNFDISAAIMHGDIFNPTQAKYLYSNVYPNFKPEVVSHVDADITSMMTVNLHNEIKHTFQVYPNARSAVFVHASRNMNIKSQKTNTLLDTPIYKKIQSLFSLIRQPSNTAFRNLVAYQQDRKGSGKGVIIDSIANTLKTGRLFVQSYKGRGPMLSFTVCRTNAPFEVTYDENAKRLFSNVPTQSDIDDFKLAYNRVMKAGYRLNNAMLYTANQNGFTPVEYNQMREILGSVNKLILELQATV